MSGSRGVASGVGLPPREAIAFLRGKTNVTSEHWTDVWREAHTRSFMVAGAATDALVGDFRRSVADALEQGRTLADFRKDFDGIVAKHGWVHNGTAAWRSRIIYETNLSTALAAGRYAQQTEPDTLAVYPYWQYVHSGALHPRLQHQAWNGLILRADDGFWRTHYPPNGWRCGCRVRVLSARGLARMGRSGPDQAPVIETRRWVNPRTGEVHYVPVGIDPGFDYNPGLSWREPPRLPSDAVLRPPPASWPPAPPGGWPAAAPPAPRPTSPIPDRGVVPVLPAEPTSRDVPLPPARALPAKPVVRRDPVPASVRSADIALREGYEEWGRSLSQDELAAVALYRRTGQYLNRVVRGDEVGTPGMRTTVAILRDALQRAVAPRAFTVRRGASAAEANGLGSVGTVGELPAFTSSSLDPEIARDFAARHGGRLIEIRVPGGARGVAYIHPWPLTRPAQYEVLFAPGTQYRVVSRTSRRIVVEIIRVGDQPGGG